MQAALLVVSELVLGDELRRSSSMGAWSGRGASPARRAQERACAPGPLSIRQAWAHPDAACASRPSRRTTRETALGERRLRLLVAEDGTIVEAQAGPAVALLNLEGRKVGRLVFY